MANQPQEHSFGDLPQSLVDSLLQQAEGIATSLGGSLGDLQGAILKIRERLGSSIKLDRDLGVSQAPTSCGVDGSYMVERLVSADVAAFAALAIEGITPPSETRFWPEPRHDCRLYQVPHHASTTQVLRGHMMGHEMLLANAAPHEVVMLDFSMRTPVIYLNNGASNYHKATGALRKDFGETLPAALLAYRDIARSKKISQNFVGIPKYSTLSEFSASSPETASLNDRALFSMVLKAGEYVGPVPIAQDDEVASSWHITHLDEFKSEEDLNVVWEQLKGALHDAHVVYYKPRAYLPAFRLEMAAAVGTNRARLGSVLKAIEFQSAAPGVFEPFPLYMADRMVKHLATALPSIMHHVRHQIAMNYRGDVGEVFMATQGYRTEGGR